MTSPATPYQFDYVIIGSGSAGSAIAYRLATAGQGTIAVIEFGGGDAGPLYSDAGCIIVPNEHA
jgi:choline dehydrogenase